MALVKKELDQWLDEVDYSYLNSSKYVPSEFSLKFLNFIKLVNGGIGESNKTPAFHLAMLDKVISNSQRILNLCFRGASKTTLFMEYFTLYVAVIGELPGIGDLDGFIYVADSMENGVKSARKNIEYRYERSDFLKKWLPKTKFTDNYLEFENIEGHKLGVKMFGATTGLRGTKIFGKRPKLCHEIGTPVLTDMGWHPVEEYNHQGEARITYGRRVSVFGMVHSEVVTDEHRYMTASLIKRRRKEYLPNGKTNSTTNYSWISPRWVSARDLVVNKLLGNQKVQNDYLCKKVDLTVIPIPPLKQYESIITQRNAKGQIVSTKRIVKEDLYSPMFKEEWWWLYGLYLADGHSVSNGIGFTLANTQKDTVGKKLKEYAEICGYTLGSYIRNKPGCYQVSIADSVIDRFLRENHIGNSIKNIPTWILQIDPKYQKQLLLGYIAGDGYIQENQIRINSINKDAICKLGIICERLGLPYRIHNTRTKEFYSTFPNKQVCLSHKQYELRLSQNVNKVLGINIKEVPSTEVFFKDGWLYRKVKKVEITKEPHTFIPIQTPDHTYQTLFGTSHNCILDDLISDEDARSQTVMDLIRSTIYSGVVHALDPNNNKIVFSGTPFHKEDVLVQAVESGGWDVNVYPVCEKFPCTKEEFRGAWEDRFSYEKVKQEYEFALANGVVNTFYQEKMLRLTSDDERLIQDSEIKWYSRMDLLNRKEYFNFYMTTDFATSTKNKADDTVISIWAYNCNGDWFWVDGYCDKVTMDQTVDRIFRLVQEYHPQEVGVEVTGQQKGFVSILEKEMLRRNIFFVFARMKGSTEAGIRPAIDKLSRFNLVVPWFKMGKIYFPEEMKSSVIMGTFMKEIKLATRNGIKGHDDCIDTISMLAYMNPWKPAEAPKIIQSDDGIYSMEPEPEELSAISSYIV